MDVRRSAEEERRIKLLEYLAAKGKLKPQNNSKPYLKDCTNRQYQEKKQPSKPAPFCKQRENVLPKEKSASQANKLKTFKPLPFKQTSKSVPSKGILPVSTKPRTIQLPGNVIPTKPSMSGTIKDQHKVASKTQTRVEIVGGEAPVCNLLPNSVNASEGGEEEGNINEIHMKAASHSLELSSSVEPFQKENACAFVERRTAARAIGARAIGAQAKGKESNLLKQSHRTSGRLASKSLASRTQPLHPKEVPKTFPGASQTRRATNKPAAPVHTGQTNIVSRPKQPTLSQSKNNPVRPWLVKNSRTGPSSSRGIPSAGLQNASQSTLKPNHVKKPSPDLPSTAVVCKNVGVLQRGTNSFKSGASNLVECKPAPRAHSMGNVSKKPLQKQSLWSSSKQGTKDQSTESALSTKSAPRRNPNTCIKAGQIQKKASTIPSHKSNKPVTNLTICSKQSDLGTSNTTSRQHTTPKTAAEDRKKKLEEWLHSKGKSYKRPPMTLPTKHASKGIMHKSLNCSMWEGIEEEEELLNLSQKINQTLSECLELINQGVPSESIHAVLATVPEAQQFAKFWVCKARLLEREGTFDVIGLYEQAVKLGVTPIEELRDVVFDLLRNTGKKNKAVTFGPLPNEDDAQESQQCVHKEAGCPNSPSGKPIKGVVIPSLETTCEQGSTVKFQVACLSSKKSEHSGQDWKVLTPVRRSLRIKHSVSRYPEILKEHGTVVASLGELLDEADTDCYVYWRNEALPEEADKEILCMMNKSEGQVENPS